jgi:hypothetical protein
MELKPAFMFVVTVYVSGEPKAVLKVEATSEVYACHQAKSQYKLQNLVDGKLIHVEARKLTFADVLVEALSYLLRKS